jgi:hypothetical protein
VLDEIEQILADYRAEVRHVIEECEMMNACLHADTLALIQIASETGDLATLQRLADYLAEPRAWRVHPVAGHA